MVLESSVGFFSPQFSSRFLSSASLLLFPPANLFTFYMLCWRVCGMSDSARVYLSCLAVVDTWYLLWVTLLDLSLVFLQPQPFWHTHPWCGVINILQFGMFYASAWLVVAFTIERYLVFRVMVSRQRHQHFRHALLTCTTIVLLSHLASIPLSWINAVVQVQKKHTSHLIYTFTHY